MNGTLRNKFSSFQSTLQVANAANNKGVWEGKQPAVFGELLEEASAAVEELRQAGVLQSEVTTGSADALKNLREQFEDALHPLARATFRALKKANRLEDAPKADLTPSDLHSARAGALAGTGETVLDLAESLTKDPTTGAPITTYEKYGINAAIVDEVDALWERYSAAVGSPASARSIRKAKTTTLPGQFAAVEALFAELDDYIVQFKKSAEGRRFITEWFNARRINDLGHRAAKPKETTGTPPA